MDVDGTGIAVVFKAPNERRGFTLGGDLELGYFKNSLRALSEAIDASVFVTDSTGASLFCTESWPISS